MNHSVNYNYVKHIPGWMNWYDLSILSMCSSLVPDNSCAVEIGGFCGRSSSVIAANKKDSCKFHSIDLWEFSDTYPIAVGYSHPDLTEEDIRVASKLARDAGSWKAVWDNFVPHKPNVFGLKLHSDNYNVQANTMFAFIDGDHSRNSVYTDLNKFIGIKECLIIGDDFTKKFKDDVPLAVLDHYLEHNDRYLISFPKSKLYALWPTVGYWADKLPLVLKEYNKILQT